MHSSFAKRMIGHARRGSALMLTMVFTLALGGLAISAIYMSGSSTMLSKLYDRERDYRYAAEWALAVGKSRITVDTMLTLPDSLYLQLMNGQSVTDASGGTVPKVMVDLYAGVGGGSTGQYGRFVELVAVAYDAGGARHVRRLEVQAENFARYAMFVDQWPTGACYATGEILRGRSHSNQNFKNCSSAPGAIYTDTVSAVNTVTGTAQFQVKVNGAARIPFPSVSRLSFMPGYAASANLSFTPNPVVGSVGGSRMEFVAVDLDGNGALTGPAEGYFRVFDSTVDTTRTRMSWTGGNNRIDNNMLAGAQRVNVMNHCGLNYVFDIEPSGVSERHALCSPCRARCRERTVHLVPGFAAVLGRRRSQRHDRRAPGRPGPHLRPARTPQSQTSSMRPRPVHRFAATPAGDPHLMPVERREPWAEAQVCYPRQTGAVAQTPRLRLSRSPDRGALGRALAVQERSCRG